MAEREEASRVERPLPLIDSGPPANRIIRAATEVLRALEEEALLPESAPAPSAESLEGEISLALHSLIGQWWELSDEALRSVWRRPATQDEPGATEIPRRARRRIRRALRGLELDALRQLEPEFWREQMLAQAAAMALRKSKCSLADALLHLLSNWPATSHLAVRSGGDLGAAVQLCPPARALLLRIRDAAIAALGL